MSGFHFICKKKNETQTQIDKKDKDKTNKTKLSHVKPSQAKPKPTRPAGIKHDTHDHDRGGGGHSRRHNRKGGCANGDG